jgi:hypothetical protein
MARFGSAQDFMQIPVRQFRAETSAVPPSDPVAGQLWTDTSVNPAKVRWWDGTKWVAADGTSIPAGYITDTHISSTAAIALSKLATDPLARANHTGVQPSSTISDFDARVRTSRLDQLAAPTQNLDINGVRLTNVATPVAASDAANKSYVDNARAGLSVKDPVRVVAQGNVNLNSPGTTVDGIALNGGDRFLASRQNTGIQNGIYVYTGASSAATRATDADSAGEVVDGSMLAVAEGTDAGRQYIQTVTASGAPGSWTQDWVVFTMGGQTYTAGNGLSISGTEFSLAAPVSIANGGTGASTAVAARSNLGALTKYAADLGSVSAGVSYSINHGLNSTDVGVWFKTTADNRVIDIDWASTGANTISAYADVSFAAGSLRVVVVG